MTLNANQSLCCTQHCPGHLALSAVCLMQLLLGTLRLSTCFVLGCPKHLLTLWLGLTSTISQSCLPGSLSKWFCCCLFIFVHSFAYLSISSWWCQLSDLELCLESCLDTTLWAGRLFLRLHSQECSFPPPGGPCLEALSNLSLSFCISSLPPTAFLPLLLGSACLGSLSWQLLAGFLLPSWLSIPAPTYTWV